MAVSDTLLIKNLPFQLNQEEKTTFLKKCGAIGIKILASKRKKYNVAFARFANAALAQRAMQQLHQQEVMGSYLVVQYARGNTTNDFDESQQPINVPHNKKADKIKEVGTEVILQRFLEKLNTWSDGVDFRMAIPAHLRFHYPPPTPGTLNNISQQMSAVPQFYTQVLHLMNKMNLPCPFETIKTHEEGSVGHQQQVPVEETESESEMSSDDDVTVRKPVNVQSNPKIRNLKRPKILKPVASIHKKKIRKTNFEDVFEDPKDLVATPKPKNLVEKKPDVQISSSASGFGFLEPVVKVSVEEEKARQPEIVRNAMEEERIEKEVVVCISAEALSSNRIPEKDLDMLPVFKNYAAGAPSCRLYVKNLAKQTTEDDLKFIFSRFKSDDLDVATQSLFDIRLMQEGRMKGQAFITLDSVEQAQQALAQTNAYLLHDKPMVVQFARSATK